jgi:hypothetical protein
MSEQNAQLKIIQLEKELDKAIDENIDLKAKLKKHHEIDYKEKYLALKDKMKLVIYDE